MPARYQHTHQIVTAPGHDNAGERHDRHRIMLAFRTSQVVHFGCWVV